MRTRCLYCSIKHRVLLGELSKVPGCRSTVRKSYSSAPHYTSVLFEFLARCWRDVLSTLMYILASNTTLIIRSSLRRCKNSRTVWTALPPLPHHRQVFHSRGIARAPMIRAQSPRLALTFTGKNHRLLPEPIIHVIQSLHQSR
jgi:hypothetical protein